MAWLRKSVRSVATQTESTRVASEATAHDEVSSVLERVLCENDRLRAEVARLRALAPEWCIPY